MFFPISLAKRINFAETRPKFLRISQKSSTFARLLYHITLSESSHIYNGSAFLMPDKSAWSEYELISRSPYNCVWRAKADGQWFILKAARTDIAGEQAHYLHLLQREYDLLRRLDNPYIVKVWQWHEDKKVGSCIVEEYVSGKPLSDWLQHAPSTSQRKQILSELLEAVEYIHAKQIVHGDIKPQNILITDNGSHVKLIDFSMADADAFTAKNIGYSNAYAAPEQKNGLPTDCRTDIYAIGLIIQLLFPHRFAYIVRRCTKFNLELRYTTVTALRRALQRAILVPRWTTAFVIILTLLTVAFFALRSYRTTLSQPSHAEIALLDSLHAEYQSITDLYADSIRLAPEYKLEYEGLFVEEYLRIKNDAQTQYPAFHKLIEQDMIDTYTSYINQLDSL